MRNTMKVVLFSILVLAVLLVVPTISNASSETVSDEAGLVEAIGKADVDTITLGGNITLNTTAIEIYRNVTIIGNGYSIIGTAEMKGASSPSNKTIITAMPGAQVTLENITLANAPKYGVQAYNGGNVILNGVTINNCNFGGVLINGGNVTIKNLSLGYNGETSNNGIELDKADDSFPEPTLIMDGRLSTTQTKNVVRILSDANIANSNDTINKVFVNDNNVILADANNNVIAEGAVEGNNVSINEDVQKVILTIIVGNTKKEIVIDEGKTITKEFVENYVKLADNQVIDGYYTNETYSTEFDFGAAINANTSIYVKVSTSNTDNGGDNSSSTPEEQPVAEEGEKDETPKTGVASYLGIAAGVAIIATVAVISLKKEIIN